MPDVIVARLDAAMAALTLGMEMRIAQKRYFKTIPDDDALDAPGAIR